MRCFVYTPAFPVSLKRATNYELSSPIALGTLFGSLKQRFLPANLILLLGENMQKLGPIGP